MLRLIAVFLSILLAMTSAPFAAGAPRLALVIGNGTYGTLGNLANPVNDSRLIAQSLRNVAFDVTVLNDADQRGLKRGILDFGRKLRAAGPTAVGLFYFAGHGVQARGRNYLIPTGVDVRAEADLDVEAVDADWVLRQMESAQNATNIVILDACRNNPFERSFRSAGSGLARMDAPTGSFIAYATAPGSVAADGAGRNSPYSSALARAIADQSVPIEQMFKKVRIDVISQTGGQQVPWDSSSLVSDFRFRAPAPVAAPAPIPVAPAPVAASVPAPPSAESLAWAAARRDGSHAAIQRFITLFPQGRNVGVARQLLAALAPVPAPVPPAPAKPTAALPTMMIAAPSPAQRKTFEVKVYAESSAGVGWCTSTMLGEGQGRIPSSNADEWGSIVFQAEFHLKARIKPKGSGYVLTAVPSNRNNQGNPLEIPFSLQDGAFKATAYGSFRPNSVECSNGQIAYYFEIREAS